MPLTTTSTSSITATMSLSSNTDTISASRSLQESADSPVTAMQLFTPGQCLLCPNSSQSLNDSLIHMQKLHGLFIPHRQHLVVDLETLIKYLHLIVFGYRECIQCGITKSTVHAIQRHMIDKCHCKFDISEADSEFAEFYDFLELEDGAEIDIKGDCVERKNEVSKSISQSLLLNDKDLIHLPSGKIISKKLSAQAEASLLPRFQRRNRAMTPRIEYSTPEPDDEEYFSKEGLNPKINGTKTLSKREKREKAMVKSQLKTMSANDRNSLMHLSAPQQRSILAMQQRQGKNIQKEDRRRQSHVDRKGNKNLYAYWATETPVYLCG